MELIDAIQERKSIRGYLDRSVSQQALRDVLQLATRAISAENAQPWEFAIVSGDVLKAISDDNIEHLRSGVTVDSSYDQLDGIYRRRRVDIAKQLYGAMGIAREDRPRRNWWLERGYRFFDAPAAIILYMDSSLDVSAYRFDMGCVTQNICLAAQAYGLGTCVEYQAVTYQDVLRKHLAIPESKYIVCAIAIGYPDPNFPANHVVSTREMLDNNTTWYGF